MTTQVYLSQLRTIDLEISMSRTEEVSWLDLATKMSGGISENKVQTSPSPDRMESLVVKAADCALKANREREMLIYTKATIERQIKALDDSELRFFLWGYYHDKKTVEKLSREVHVDKRQGWRIMKKASDAFEDIWGHTYM